MTVTLSEDRIRISGPARIEDAEHLVVLLQSDRGRVVDLAAAEVLHTAVVQVLMAFRPAVSGFPDDPLFRAWLLPSLTGPVSSPEFVATADTVAEPAVSGTAGPGPSTPSEQR